MPIAFPRATGSPRSCIESQWLRLATKSFDAVPAPNLGRIGARFGSNAASIAGPVNGGVNVRRLNAMFQAADQTARVNPIVPYTNNQLNGDDRVLGAQSERLIGVSRDAGGTPLGLCVVKVFRTLTDELVATTTSDGSGNWTVYPNAIGPYYIVEYKAGSPDVFGTSLNTNASTQFTPGQ